MSDAVMTYDELLSSIDEHKSTRLSNGGAAGFTANKPAGVF